MAAARVLVLLLVNEEKLITDEIADPPLYNKLFFLTPTLLFTSVQLLCFMKLVQSVISILDAIQIYPIRMQIPFLLPATGRVTP
jgi:hypothetical protein